MRKIRKISWIIIILTYCGGGKAEEDVKPEELFSSLVGVISSLWLEFPDWKSDKIGSIGGGIIIDYDISTRKANILTALHVVSTELFGGLSYRGLSYHSSPFPLFIPKQCPSDIQNCINDNECYISLAKLTLCYLITGCYEILKDKIKACPECNCSECGMSCNDFISYIESGTETTQCINLPCLIKSISNVLPNIKTAIEVFFEKPDITYEAKIEKLPACPIDIAQISAKMSVNAKPSKISTTYIIGDEIYAIGFPFGFKGVSKGRIVSLLSSEGECKTEYIVSDIYVGEGSSGGGFFDRKGNLIGIVVAKDGDMGIGISLKYIESYLKSISSSPLVKTF